MVRNTKSQVKSQDLNFGTPGFLSRSAIKFNTAGVFLWVTHFQFCCKMSTITIPLEVSLVLENLVTQTEYIQKPLKSTIKTRSSSKRPTPDTVVDLTQFDTNPKPSKRAKFVSRPNNACNSLVVKVPAHVQNGNQLLHSQALTGVHKGLFKSKVAKNALGFCISLTELWVDMAWGKKSFFRLCRKYGYLGYYTLKVDLKTADDLFDLVSFFRFFQTLLGGKTLLPGALDPDFMDPAARIKFEKCFPFDVLHVMRHWASDIALGKHLSFPNCNAEWCGHVPLTPLHIIQLNGGPQGLVKHGKASAQRVLMFKQYAWTHVRAWRYLWSARCCGKYVPRRSDRDPYPFM